MKFKTKVAGVKASDTSYLARSWANKALPVGVKIRAERLEALMPCYPRNLCYVYEYRCFTSVVLLYIGRGTDDGFGAFARANAIGAHPSVAKWVRDNNAQIKVTVPEENLDHDTVKRLEAAMIRNCNPLLNVQHAKPKIDELTTAYMCQLWLRRDYLRDTLGGLSGRDLYRWHSDMRDVTDAICKHPSPQTLTSVIRDGVLIGYRLDGCQDVVGLDHRPSLPTANR